MEAYKNIKRTLSRDVREELQQGSRRASTGSLFQRMRRRMSRSGTAFPGGMEESASNHLRHRIPPVTVRYQF